MGKKEDILKLKGINEAGELLDKEYKSPIIRDRSKEKIKRRKEEIKIEKEIQAKKDGKLFYCEYCEKEVPAKNFYKVVSKVEFEHRNNRVTICKECMIKKCFHGNNNEKFDVEGFQDMLRDLNLPFYTDVFATLTKGNIKNLSIGILGKYVSYLSLKKSEDVYWNKSIFDKNNLKLNQELIDNENFINLIEINTLADTEDKLEILPKMFRWRKTLQHKYGEHYSNEQLINFERNYIKLRPIVELTNSIVEQDFIKYIIYNELEKMIMGNPDSTMTDSKSAQERTAKALKNVPFIEKGQRSSSMSSLLKKVVENKGNFDFIKKGYTTTRNDYTDLAIHLLQIKTMKNMGIDVEENLELTDIYRMYDVLAKEYKNLDNNYRKIESLDDLYIKDVDDRDD